MPISLLFSNGSGMLNARHKATGELFPQAIDVMTTLNASGSRAALDAGVRCATDVTGFGCWATCSSWPGRTACSAVVKVAGGAADRRGPGRRAAAGYVPGGSRRNLDWVIPHTDPGGLSRGGPATPRGRADLPAGC